MFTNLIESGSHRRDLARRGRFLLGTLALYSALVAAAGVASVYAYNARLDAQAYEVTLLPPWAVPAAVEKAAEPNPPAGQHHTSGGELTVRKNPTLDLTTTPHTPPPVSTQPSGAKPLPPGVPYKIGKDDYDPANAYSSGPIGPGGPGRDSVPVASGAPSHVFVATDDVKPPEPARPTPAPTPRRPIPLSTVISSKVVSKPVPPYPQIAKLTHTEGTVNVEIIVDEQGRVVSATPKDGPLMLREAARQAALLARFTPTQLNGEPVKVSGVISYNFTLR